MGLETVIFGDLVKHKAMDAYYLVGEPKSGAYYNKNRKTWVYKCDKEGRLRNPDSLGYAVVTENLELFKGENQMDTKTLYEIASADGANNLYGYKLAVDSSGQWIMEVKGTGNIVAVDKSKVQEVLPFTLGVKYDSGITYHYFAEAGQFEKGFYIHDNHHGRSIVEVVELDSKSKKANREFKPLAKLVVDKTY